jgi:hypothetical protein
MLGVMQAAGRRREAAKAAVREQRRAEGPSSSGMALERAEFEITTFFKLPKAGRSEIIRRLQRRYQGEVAVLGAVT